MSMSDPIADLCTRIRNAIMRGHQQVTMPYSRLKQGILNVLKEEGFIETWEKVEDKSFPFLVVSLKYSQTGEGAIRKIARESKPGLRIYKGIDDLKPILNGQGIAIVTTSNGVLSDKECRKQKIGGEVLCIVW